MRHWQQLSDDIQMNVKPKATLTFSRCLEMGLHNHVEEIATAAEGAGKEYAIEQVVSSAQGASIELDLFGSYLYVRCYLIVICWFGESILPVNHIMCEM